MIIIHLVDTPVELLNWHSITTTSSTSSYKKASSSWHGGLEKKKDIYYPKERERRRKGYFMSDAFAAAPAMMHSLTCLHTQCLVKKNKRKEWLGYWQLMQILLHPLSFLVAVFLVLLSVGIGSLTCTVIAFCWFQWMRSCESLWSRVT